MCVITYIMTRYFAKCVTALISDKICSLRLREALRNLFAGLTFSTRGSFRSGPHMRSVSSPVAPFFRRYFFSYSRPTRETHQRWLVLLFFGNKQTTQANKCHEPLETRVVVAKFKMPLCSFSTLLIYAAHYYYVWKCSL